MDKTIIRLDNIAKSFGNVRVIHHISFSIEAGKVYALAGENGAGKSTLCNIISGSLKPDEGTISYGDKEYSSFTIQQAKEIGIKMVHQELQILPLMNVEENIFIGEESSRRGFVNKNEIALKHGRFTQNVFCQLKKSPFLRNLIKKPSLRNLNLNFSVSYQGAWLIVNFILFFFTCQTFYLGLH